MRVQFKCPNCKLVGPASVSGGKLVCANGECNHLLLQEDKVELKQQKQVRADDNVSTAPIFAFDKARVHKFLRQTWKMSKGLIKFVIIPILMSYLFNMLLGTTDPAPELEPTVPGLCVVSPQTKNTDYTSTRLNVLKVVNEAVMCPSSDEIMPLLDCQWPEMLTSEGITSMNKKGCSTERIKTMLSCATAPAREPAAQCMGEEKLREKEEALAKEHQRVDEREGVIIKREQAIYNNPAISYDSNMTIIGIGGVSDAKLIAHLAEQKEQNLQLGIKMRKQQEEIEKRKEQKAKDAESEKQKRDALEAEARALSNRNQEMLDLNERFVNSIEAAALTHEKRNMLILESMMQCPSVVDQFKQQHGMTSRPEYKMANCMMQAFIDNQQEHPVSVQIVKSSDFPTDDTTPPHLNDFLESRTSQPAVDMKKTISSKGSEFMAKIKGKIDITNQSELAWEWVKSVVKFLDQDCLELVFGKSSTTARRPSKLPSSTYDHFTHAIVVFSSADPDPTSTAAHVMVVLATMEVSKFKSLIALMNVNGMPRIALSHLG